MSLTTQTARAQYTLTGSGQTLAVPFYFLAADHLKVTKTVAGVDTDLVLTTNYTVSGVGVPAGGSITLVAGAADDVVTITRAIPFDQDTVLAYLSQNPNTVLERAYDYLAMQVQRLNEEVKRTIRVSLSSDEVAGLTKAARAGKTLQFNATTGALELTDSASSSATAAAASAAAAEIYAEEAESNKDAAALSAALAASSAASVNFDAIPFAKGTQQFVFEGDSIMSGLTSPNTMSMPQYLATKPPFAGMGTFTNVASPGYKLDQIAARYTATVKPYRPAVTGSTRSVLFVLIGANDYPFWVGTKTAAAWVAELVTYWTTAIADGFFVVGFTIMDRTGTTNDGYLMQQWRMDANALLIEEANKLSIPIVDIDVLMSRFITDTTKFIDGTHPTNLGNRIMGDETISVVMAQAKPLVPANRSPGKAISLAVSEAMDSALTRAAIQVTTATANLSPIYPATPAIGTGDFTFECWAKPDSGYAPSGGGTTVYVLRNSGLTVGFGFFTPNLSTNPTECFFQPGTTWSRSYVAADKWNHLVVTREGTTLKFYVNGVLTRTTTNNSSIGSITHGIDRRSKVARIRVYTRALTQAQVLANIQTLSAFDPLEASYLLALSDGCDNAGLQVQDLGPNKCHLCLNVASAKIIHPQLRGRFQYTSVGNEVLAGGNQVLPANCLITGYSVNVTTGGNVVDISTTNGTGSILDDTALPAGLSQLVPRIPFSGAGSIYCNAAGSETVKHTIDFMDLGNPVVASALTYGGVFGAVLRASAVLNFPSIAAGSYSDLSISCPGAQPGDSVALGIPNPSLPAAGVVFMPSVFTANQVNVRCINNTAGAVDPASGTFTATVLRP